jgi:hypothetical protein
MRWLGNLTLGLVLCCVMHANAWADKRVALVIGNGAKTVQSAARRFVGAAQSADVAIFYYSGHAVQFNGVNYLMPVDAKVEGEAEWSRSIPRITSKFMRLSAAATSSADDRVLHSGPLPVYES